MSERTNFGLDAPGVIRNLAAAGVAGLVAGYALLRMSSPSGPSWRASLAAQLLSAGLWFVITALLMVASSLFGKRVAARRLVKRLRLRGDETVLDVGCGHGVLLVTAAEHLPRGRAIGVDLWSQVDQKDNNSAATFANAAVLGVRSRVEVCDGDMRALPFEDASIDAVISSLAIHNLPTRSDRKRALAEIARVLKPGGKVAILDIWNVQTYARDLRALGMIDVHARIPSAFIAPPARTVTATRPPAEASAGT